LNTHLVYAILSSMDINWLGHSCFRIKGRNVSIVTDPYPPDLGYSLGKPSADIVTVSHPHPGHSYTHGVSGDPRLVRGPGEYEISGVLIIGIATFHDNDKGAKRGKNTIYLMDVDGVSVCHLGDLGHVLTADQVEQIEEADVLLLPVGGVSTINAAVAAEVVRQLEPKVVVPMHYRTDALNRGLATVDGFLKEMGQKEITSQPRLTLTRTTLPLTTQVVLLDY
jgi:L-ascorbate metabolism protein UlaG (beta-lactamase superfamily)